MVDTWQTIAKKFLPDLESLGEPRRVSKTADVIGVLYGIPFTLLALAWLIGVTQLRPLLTAWPVLLLSFILLVLLRRLEFFVMVELTPGRFADFSGSLDGIIAWAAVLIFGPAALWLHIICNCLNLVIEWQQDLSGERRYALMRNFLFTLSGTVLSTLVILTLYRQWGGSIPLPGLEWHVVRLGLYVTLARFCLSLLVWLPYFAYLGRSKTVTATKSSRQTFIKFVGLSMSWPLLSDPFAIFAAGLYTQIGIEGYLFFAVAVLLSSLLARQLSRVGVRSQSRSREMANLEQLGRAIISAPPDIFSLQQVLQTHIPTMFMGSTIEIRLFPDQTLLHYPKDYAPASPALWEWLAGIDDVEVFLPEDVLPWDMEAPFNGATLIVSPILDAETGATIGGICLTSYAQHRNPDLIKDSVPSVKSLAAQITSALYSARVHEQILEHQRVSQELSMAGRIQFSFLPHNISDISGWQLAAKLYPAYETSGDFYDVIPLPNGRVGILVADVADKGMGAALYMALSRTLLRTYATQYHARPDYVFRIANRRILMDSDAGLFVTVFYGVLDPTTGTLTYCNAGHMPPYIVRGKPDGNDSLLALPRTGIPLGIFEREDWQRSTVTLAPGDALVLYTDGITDAENQEGEFFGMERLREVLRHNREQTAHHMQKMLLSSVSAFVGAASQFDDVTLMVVRRDIGPAS